MTEHSQPTLLVTGASGQLGRRVIELLLAQNAGTIIAATRNPDKLADLKDQGVIVRHADFDDPDSLAKAFSGVDRLLLISTDVLGEGDKRLKQHQVAVKAADEAGVKHVVYTSLASADESPILFAPDHAGTEQALESSSMGYTISRNNIYMDLLPYSIAQAYNMGGLFSTTGDHKIAYITREDCAKAAATALASSFEGRRILEISGGEAYSQPEIAEIASSLTGKPLPVVPIDLETSINGMVSAGLPRPLAEIYASIDTARNQDTLSTVTDNFKALTGEEATSLPDFLAANKASLS